MSGIVYDMNEKQRNDYVACANCGSNNLEIVIYSCIPMSPLYVRCKDCGFECKDWPRKPDQELLEMFAATLAREEKYFKLALKDRENGQEKNYQIV